MTQTLVLVGRPNVGKSTLFNRLTRTRAAIVADMPGLTRDRQYGHGRVGDFAFIVVDTGGFEPVASTGILESMARQTEQAIAEADAVVFVVDSREGVTAQDVEIAARLRSAGRRVFLAVNKSEGLNPDIATAEFHELGLGEPHPISAAHGQGVRALLEEILGEAPADAEPPVEDDHPRIAVVGRPNVGKSTLVNALLGEERMIAFDEPGTTRDSIHVDFERNGRHYTLIDTAGIRRRGKVQETVEKFSVLKTLQSIEDANVAILVLDARQEVSEQDAHIAGFILEAGRALVVAINKWDGLDPYQRDRIKREYDRKLDFLRFARVHFVSALQGQGVPAVLQSVGRAYAAAMASLPTPRLTRLLQEAVARQQPPRSGLTRPKLRYAHQGGSNPPVIVVHGNALDSIPASYWRYLERYFTEAFRLEGTPVRVQYKRGGANPFAGRAR